MSKPKKEPSFPFVLEELENLLGPQIYLKLIFGSYGVYLEDKILFILREKNQRETIADDGLWVAMPEDSVTSVKKEFPQLRPIKMFADSGKKGFAGWLLLPKTNPRFEELALELCALVGAKDPRIGKIPGSKKKVVRKAK